MYILYLDSSRISTMALRAFKNPIEVRGFVAKSPINKNEGSVTVSKEEQQARKVRCLTARPANFSIEDGEVIMYKFSKNEHPLHGKFVTPAVITIAHKIIKGLYVSTEDVQVLEKVIASLRGYDEKDEETDAWLDVLTVHSHLIRCVDWLPSIHKDVNEIQHAADYLEELIKRGDLQAVNQLVESVYDKKIFLNQDWGQQLNFLEVAVRKWDGYDSFFVNRDRIVEAKKMVKLLLSHGMDTIPPYQFRHNVYDTATSTGWSFSSPIPETLEVLPPRPVDPPIVKVVLQENE
jgi:hypothetical protein